jgi:membrane-bound metal-dependent hydrolase YbcI (DUF457 family)
MNGKQHRQIGAVAGAFFTIAKHYFEKADNPEKEFPWGELALNTGIGYVLGSLPDWIKPAVHSHHRKFFHSTVAGAGVAYGAFGEHARNWDEEFKVPVQGTALAYISHLVADATTPRGIALVHPKFI